VHTLYFFLSSVVLVLSFHLSLSYYLQFLVLFFAPIAILFLTSSFPEICCSRFLVPIFLSLFHRGSSAKFSCDFTLARQSLEPRDSLTKRRLRKDELFGPTPNAIRVIPTCRNSVSFHFRSPQSFFSPSHQPLARFTMAQLQIPKLFDVSGKICLVTGMSFLLTKLSRLVSSR
jgi:hypothetical protein